MVQSRFALQSLTDDDKREVLGWVCGHARRFVLVEFDVPPVADVWDPYWFHDCAARLERGLREYGQERDLVGLGFILPVVLGRFSTTPPVNHELAISRWRQLCVQAGFREVRAVRVVDHWWRPAYLVRAWGQGCGTGSGRGASER
ncbi:hypothetical protein EIL87_01145 [Saccharopolyspora rhizosphaerae]|uniref:Uncharacterized protein n=1 Tax=Saccharopolyspora rhizosphaerae TaxID=2492662 RepID=A0A426K546_9PSEU|nr:hypothetical protein [Saccharopolyspora rhizosphaerae]RRO20528.1 hypothetical protein EIL87_01145 [Saccharopolyspora rhizosphaerae]